MTSWKSKGEYEKRDLNECLVEIDFNRRPRTNHKTLSDGKSDKVLKYAF